MLERHVRARERRIGVRVEVREASANRGQKVDGCVERLRPDAERCPVAAAVQLIRQQGLRVGMNVEDHGSPVHGQRCVHALGEPGQVGGEIVHQELLVVDVHPPDLLAPGAVGVEHAHADRVHLLGFVGEPLHVDREPGEPVDDRARARDGGDEFVGEVVGHDVFLGLQLGR